VLRISGHHYLLLPEIIFLEHSHANLKIQRWVVAVAIVLFGIKWAAYLMTGSVAILTDALESIVNIIAGLIGFFGIYVSSKPRDENHPYGHGKAEFVSAALEGILIMMAGLVIVYEAIYHLIFPHPINKLDFGILLVGFSGLVNFLMGYLALRRGRKNKSLALQASGQHLITDTYSTVAVVVGLTLVYLTHLPQIDSLVAFCIAVVIIVVGYRIARESLAGIMDEADKKVLADLVELLSQHRRENWIDLHNLRVIKYGSVLHVDCHVTVPWYFSVRESHIEIDHLRDIISEKFGESIDFFVHADGCLDFSCGICPKIDCQVRKHPFEKKIEWTLQNVISNRRHSPSTPY
jgi:cation diffusion facilitator family transporter